MQKYYMADEIQGIEPIIINEETQRYTTKLENYYAIDFLNGSHLFDENGKIKLGIYKWRKHNWGLFKTETEAIKFLKEGKV